MKSGEGQVKELFLFFLLLVLVWQQKQLPGCWWVFSAKVFSALLISHVRLQRSQRWWHVPTATPSPGWGGSPHSCLPLVVCKTHAFLGVIFRYFKGHWDGYFFNNRVESNLIFFSRSQNRQFQPPPFQGSSIPQVQAHSFP